MFTRLRLRDTTFKKIVWLQISFNQKNEEQLKEIILHDQIPNNNTYVIFIVIFNEKNNELIKCVNHIIVPNIIKKIEKIEKKINNSIENNNKDIIACISYEEENFKNEKKDIIIQAIKKKIKIWKGRAKLLILNYDKLTNELEDDEIKLLGQNRRNLKCCTEKELFDKFEEVVLNIINSPTDSYHYWLLALLLLILIIILILSIINLIKKKKKKK